MQVISNVPLLYYYQIGELVDELLIELLDQIEPIFITVVVLDFRHCLGLTFLDQKDPIDTDFFFKDLLFELLDILHNLVFNVIIVPFSFVQLVSVHLEKANGRLEVVLDVKLGPGLVLVCYWEELDFEFGAGFEFEVREAAHGVLDDILDEQILQLNLLALVVVH